MTLSRLHLLPAASLLALAALVVSGCSSTPASPAPTNSGASDTAAPAPDDDTNDIEAAWLAEGRFVGIVTWGSSSLDCQPAEAEVTADGQRLSITLSDLAEDAVCTADLVPRAIAVPVPEGVDVTKDVEIDVTYGDLADDTDLSALPQAPQGASGQGPSAGWFDDKGIVLMTWGSSTCVPIVSDVTETADGAAVTFTSADRPCTMDLRPRATVITVPTGGDDQPFTLTLTGDNLDGTVTVIG